MKLIRSFLKEEHLFLWLTLLLPLLFMIVFLLYELPAEPFLYALVLYAAMALCIWTVRYFAYRRQHAARIALLRELVSNPQASLTPAVLADEDYAEILRTLTVRIQ